MNTFQLTIASPDGNLFCGEAVKISLRGQNGDLAILAGHIPFITPVRAGDCRIELPDGSEQTGTADSGLLTVAAGGVTLLSDSFRWNEE